MPKKAEETVVKEETKKTTAQPEKSDAAVAAEIEVKKTVRKAGRKAKETVEDAVKQAASSDAAAAAEIEVKKTVRKAGRKAKEAVEDAVKQAASSDAAAVAEIEVKKTVRKAGRKAKETAEMVEKTIKKATLNIIIESPMGGSISTDEIAAKVPNGASAVYVRVDENKLYWVKGKETGSVDIWA